MKLKRICDQKWPKGTKPVVSVCCWTFNHKKFIRKALKTILMQKTAFPVEIILHDDASSDGTDRLIKTYKKKYPNLIKLMARKKNQYSVVGSLFIEPILKRASGKYIAFCEGDDYWDDSLKIQKQYECLEKNPDFSMCGHDARIIDDKNRPISASLLPDWAKRDFTSQECIEGKTYIQTLTLMARNVIKTLPMEFGRVLNADNFLTSLLGSHGGYKFCGNVQKASYRQHGGGIWTSMDQASQVFSQLVTVFWIKKYYQRQRNHDVCREYQKRLEHASETYLRTCGWVGLIAPNLGILRNRLRVLITDTFRKIVKPTYKK
jgi:glycosyltransferase involved in cell wall biosynthesis